MTQIDQISHFKLSMELSAIYHNTMEQATAKFAQNFDLMKKIGLSWTVLGVARQCQCHPSKPQEVDKLRRGLSFSGLPLLLHKR